MEKATKQKSPKKGGEKLVRESIKTKTINKAVYLEDIKEGLTGFVRIIHYTNHSINNTDQLDHQSTHNFEIEMVEEGSFLQGMRHGYCRVLHA